MLVTSLLTILWIPDEHPTMETELLIKNWLYAAGPEAEDWVESHSDDFFELTKQNLSKSPAGVYVVYQQWKLSSFQYSDTCEWDSSAEPIGYSEISRCNTDDLIGDYLFSKDELDFLCIIEHKSETFTFLDAQ